MAMAPVISLGRLVAAPPGGATTRALAGPAAEPGASLEAAMVLGMRQGCNEVMGISRLMDDHDQIQCRALQLVPERGCKVMPMAIATAPLQSRVADSQSPQAARWHLCQHGVLVAAMVQLVALRLRVHRALQGATATLSMSHAMAPGSRARSRRR